MIMQFLNKLDIYCLIIFTRFNLFLSCFVLLLLLLLGYFIYMQLTLCFMVYFFSVFSFYARSSIECFSAYNYYNTQGQDKLFLFFLSKELSSQCLHPFQNEQTFQNPYWLILRFWRKMNYLQTDSFWDGILN